MISLVFARVLLGGCCVIQHSFCAIPVGYYGAYTVCGCCAVVLLGNCYARLFLSDFYVIPGRLLGCS